MAADGGNRFLLTAAVTRYPRDPGLDRPELADDVERVVGLLTGDFGYRHVPLPGDSPTQAELRDGLRNFCRAPERQPDDLVAVYLACHGEIMEPDEFVLLPSDIDPDDLLPLAVPPRDLVGWLLRDTSVRRLLLMLDACYSGQGGQDAAQAAVRWVHQPRAADSPGVVLVTATHPWQQAQPGVFSRAFGRAVGQLASGGHVQADLPLDAVVGVINNDPAKPASQTVACHLLGLTGRPPPFLPNPRHQPSLIGADLLEQERARYAEQSAGHLRDRFLAATRWFTGRHAALTDAGGWLGNPAASGALVVTGQAGSGKTALLGLLAALSDSDQAPAVPRDGLPTGLAVPDGVITEVIYAGTMTTGQIRDRIAAAAGLRADTTGELLDGLSRRDNGPLTVLIDAVDEAADPPGLVSGLLRPLIREHRGPLRLLLGTRPDLLTTKHLGKPETGHYQLVDLDSSQYADPASIRTYIRRILLSADPLDSAYKPSGLYRTAPADTLDAITEAIGQAAGASFLVARITAATEATVARLPSPTDPAWRQALPRHAGPAMRRDLRLRLGHDADKAARLLLPLAYAQGSGLPWEDVWPRLADALSPGHGYGNDDLIWLRKAAGSYAVEDRSGGRSVYRLYHQALAEHLLVGRDQRADQQAIASTLTGLVPPGEGGTWDWPAAHPYTRTHLATHAARAERIDDLLTDPAYLLSASQPQLLAALGAAGSKPARAAADAYRRAAHRLRTTPTPQHASYLQLAARCARAPQLADALEQCRERGTWSCTWASWRLETPHRVFTGHALPVRAVAAAELNGHPVVISGSNDGSVRVWDLATGSPVGGPFTGHASMVRTMAVHVWDLANGFRADFPFTYRTPLGAVRAVAVAELDGRPVVISGHDDGSVRVWDLATGTPVVGPFTSHYGGVRAVAARVRDLAVGTAVGGPFTGPRGAVTAVAAAEMDGRPVVISGSIDGSVRVWDLAVGTPVGGPITGHAGTVTAVAATELDGHPVVISGGDDGSVRVWDLATGTPVGDLFTGHAGTVTAVAATELDGHPVVASGGDDGSVRVWDLATGTPVGGPFTGHAGTVTAVAATELDGRPVVISGGQDRSVRVWDLATDAPVGDPFTGHHGAVFTVAAAELAGLPVVISGGQDRSVRVWDLATGAPVGGPFTGHAGTVFAVAAAELAGRPVVISGHGDGSVRVWDLATGTSVGGPFTGHGVVGALAAVELEGRPVVIFGSADGSTGVRDLATGTLVRSTLSGYAGAVFAVAVGELEGHPVVIFGHGDGRVWVGDLATRAAVGGPFTGYSGAPHSVAAAELDGRPVVIFGGEDGSVRVRDLSTGAPVGGPFTVHDGKVFAVAAAELAGHPVVISGHSDGSVRVWDLATGVPVGGPFTGYSGAVHSVAAAELEGRPVVISGGDHGSVRVWDLATGAPVGDSFTGHALPVRAVAAAELDGRPVVASSGDDGSVRVWDLATGAPAGGPFTSPHGAVTALAATEVDGRPVVISGGQDRSVRVWDLATGTPAGGPYTGHAGAVNAVAVAELDGRTVVISGGDGGSVWVWYLVTGTPVGGPYIGHYGAVFAVAAAELDGRPVVASGGVDRTVRVWDLAKRKAMRYHLRRVRLRHAAPVDALTLMRRENRMNVITGCADGISKTWDLCACRMLSKTITPGRSGIRSIIILVPDHVLYANGQTVSLYKATNTATPILTIELDSEIHALAAHGTSTVVAATTLGLVALRVPH
jgi:WD40 repeat protein